MKQQSGSLYFNSCVALVVVLAATGCASRAAEDAPEPPPAPPATTMAPVEVEATRPVVEEPPPMAMPPSVDPAFFGFDSYRLSATARAVLDEAGSLMREDPALDLIIEGHCDERGTTEYNMALGEYRARAARDYLVAGGISPDRIQIISYGKERPFDAGHDEDAWARNRRAHLVVRQTALGELQPPDDSN